MAHMCELLWAYRVWATRCVGAQLRCGVGGPRCPSPPLLCAIWCRSCVCAVVVSSAAACVQFVFSCLPSPCTILLLPRSLLQPSFQRRNSSAALAAANTTLCPQMLTWSALPCAGDHGSIGILWRENVDGMRGEHCLHAGDLEWSAPRWIIRSRRSGAWCGKTIALLWRLQHRNCGEGGISSAPVQSSYVRMRFRYRKSA